MPPRPVKRRRNSIDQSNGDDKHRVFTSWATERGVQINGVEAARLPGRGLGLVVIKPLKTGDRVLFVPEKAMFKPQMNQGQASHLKAASPQAQLAISALAACMKPDSQFTVWQATWPTMEDFTSSMPILWPQHLQDLLPPSVLQPLQRQKVDYSKDWTAVRKFCADHNWTEEEFKYHWLIVNSRSFHWKPPRGKSGSMVMCPFIDYMNHGPTGTSCNVFQGPTGYEVVAERDYAIGDEILATYGAHSNDKLLVHYGFICSSSPSPSPDDSIPLTPLLLPHLPQPIQSQLQDVGFLGAYALIPSTNSICFKTEVAVRAVLLTCNEWEYFVANGEDLAGDQSGRVRAWLVPILREWGGGEVRRKLEVLSGMEGESGKGNEVAIGLLMGRWGQIRDALDAYTAG